MKNYTEPKSELFADLSETEQEYIAGGSTSNLYDLFIQKTEIATFGNGQLNASSGTGNLASNQSSAYTMSQTTIGLNLGFFFGNGPRYRSSTLNLLYRMLMSLL